MLKKFFSNKKKTREETETLQQPVAPSSGGKIVIKKRTPSKVVTNFVPSSEPFDPQEVEQELENEGLARETEERETFVGQDKVDSPFQQEPFESKQDIDEQLEIPVENDEVFEEQSSVFESAPNVKKISVDGDGASDEDITHLEAKINTLGAEKEQISSDLDISQKVVADLRAKLAKADEQNEHYLASNKDLVDKLAKFQNTENGDLSKQLNTQISKQAEQIEKLTKERNIALDEIEVLNKRYADLDVKINGLKDSSKDVSKEKKEAESEIQILQAMVNRLEAEQSEVSNESHEAIRELEILNDKLVQENIKAVEKIDLLDDQVQNLKVECVALEKQEKNKAKKLAEQKKELTSLKSEKEDLFKALKDLEGGKSGDQSVVEHAQKEIEKLKKEIEQKNLKIDEANLQIKEEQKLVKEAKSEQRKAEKELSKKDLEIEKELSNLAKVTANLEKEKKEKSEQKKTILNLQNEVKNVEVFAKKVDQLNSELEKKDGILEDSKAKLSEINSTNKEVIKENLKLTSSFEKLTNKNEILEEKLGVLKTELETHTKEKLALQSKLKETEEELKKLHKSSADLTLLHDKLVGEHKTLADSSSKELADLKVQLAESEKQVITKEKIGLDLDEKVKNLTKEANTLKSTNADLNIEVAKVNKQLIQTATKLAAASVVPAPVAPPVAEVQASVPVVEKVEEDSQIEKNVGQAVPESLTINVSVVPQGDEFELEVPGDITGMDIISELIDAEVLNEDMNFAINISHTGEAIGGEDTLFAMGVRNGDLIIIDTE